MRSSCVRPIHFLLAGTIVIGLVSCGDDTRTSTAPPADQTTVVVGATSPSTSLVTTTPTTLPLTTLPPTTLPLTTLPPTTLPPTTLPPTTLPPTTLPPTTPVDTEAPLLVAAVDPCALLSTLQVAVAFGGDAQAPIPETSADGTQRSCVWHLDADEATFLRLTTLEGSNADGSAGWPAEPVVAVDGLGERSFVLAAADDVKVGFVRRGLTITMTALFPASTSSTWTQLAKTVDAVLIAV